MMMLSTETTTRVHLNPNLKGLHPSATLAINEKCAHLRKQGSKIYHLGFGQSPFPVPECVTEALRANAFQKDYLPVKGLPELRDAVANFHRQRHQVNATSENILIGPGTKELIFLLQLTYYTDLVIPSPSWVSYEPQATLLGRKVCWLQSLRDDGWRLTPETLQKFCREDPTRPRLLILNYPNNPTGLTFREDELEGLARVAQEYKLLVLSDEIYGELDHSAKHTSIAKYYPEGTIVSSGLSKWCGAGGWRLGSFCFPSSLQWLLEAMSIVASETYSAVSAPIQYAAVKAFQGCSEIERYLFQSRRILRSLGKLVSGRLQASGVDVHPPEGAYYLFLDFTPHQEKLRGRGIVSGPQLCERLLSETGVAILPGADFGRPPSELTCRLAYVNFNGSRCLAAAEEIPSVQELSDDFLSNHCTDVLEAIDLIGRWLQ
jgi:aspartate aminotransferase